MLLGYLNEAELDVYFAGPFPLDHPCEPDHAVWLRQEARRSRERGFSITLGGALSEVHAVAAPIFHHSPRPIAAVSVSAPADRMPLSLCEERGVVIAEAARAELVSDCRSEDFHVLTCVADNCRFIPLMEHCSAQRNDAKDFDVG